jgi:hypothetical protein
VACRNPDLAERRARKRTSMLEATSRELERISRMVSRGHAFRCLKSIDLLVRPIRHRLEKRVKAHLFLCTLAYYVQWHMTEAWRPLLFADEDQQSKASRDPVAPAERSDAALKKVQSKLRTQIAQNPEETRQNHAIQERNFRLTPKRREFRLSAFCV